MHKADGQLYYSTSDLTRYMESPFAAWMDRMALDDPDLKLKKDAADVLMGLLTQKGYAHEKNLEAQFIQQGCTLLKITEKSQAGQYQQTLHAMQKGIDVIIQARLEKKPFTGFSDFLVKAPGKSHLGNYHYEVWDAKLTTTIKPTFVVQLCCYAEMLESMQGCRPKLITVVLGNGEKVCLHTQDFYDYYQCLKSAFLSEQKNFNPNHIPEPAHSKNWMDWSDVAHQQLLEMDHLLQVANITRGQIKKLNKAGIATMGHLARSNKEHIAGINSAILTKLKAQAAIQKQSVGCEQPKYKILMPPKDHKIGLALLPPHSPLDVFFDIEGYPLDEGGLEYLWGCTYFDNNTRQFKDFWAHTREQEKTAFQDFVKWVYARWQQDPKMHIYHYANYEIAACRKLMGRYGICEYEIDQLLRNEVFVDLYKIVKGGLLLGEPRYSIKNVEHLYRGKRETEVGTGGDSVAVYEQWRTLHQAGEQGGAWQTSSILKSIRDYNIDDCNSTQELTEWLREKQESNSIQFIGHTAVIEPEAKEEVTERTQLRDRLLEQALNETEVEASLTENLAWVLEFHRRETKPVFWRLFERLGLEFVELIDDLDCLAGCQRTEQAPFKPTPKSRNLAYSYQFDPTQEFKGAQKQFYVLGHETEAGKRFEVTYVREASDFVKGIIVLQSKEIPPNIVSLIPNEYVRPEPIPKAIYKTVSAYAAGELSTKKSAIIDFLRRAQPRITGHSGAIAPSNDAEERLQQIIHAIRRLDHSYLTIQGPPGAGKSYTGTRVIAALLQSGAKIGIASNSHKAINHLLLSTAKYCKKEGIAANFICTKDNDPALLEHGVIILGNGKLAQRIRSSCVVGTTAWGFAREDMTDTLDYLFVDEAGQVAMANFIGMSGAAKNLVLMGDQMQLGQPSQGTHPMESGLSVLDYLLHNQSTIADDMGIFLGTTYRMHPAINQFISKHIYEGKLYAHPNNDQRIIDVPANYKGLLNKKAGLIFVSVAHEGNTQSSDEEVAEILQLTRSLIGRTLHKIGDQQNRVIGWDDILFVAPYNHQVSKLKIALGDQAKVGSVDKFQGQEAPIVFLSMCTSDASESPRGLNFLFDKHRINVAISRAQTLAIVVGNPELGKTKTNTLDQMRLVNLFNAVTTNNN